jgi:hypothetical protein
MAVAVVVYGRLNRLVGIGLVQDVLNSLVNGVDGVGVLVGDLNAELLLDGHDNLDGVKRVETEVVGEVSGGLDVGNIVNLIKALQQAHDSALDLFLVERTTSAVEPHGLEALDLGNGYGSDAGSSEGADGGRSGSDAEGSENGGSEHVCGLCVSEEVAIEVLAAVESVDDGGFEKVMINFSLLPGLNWFCFRWSQIVLS